MSLGDELTVGNCVVVEADMDALALIDKARELGVDELVVFGPLHREGRPRGVYERRVEPIESGLNPLVVTKELWGNLTGSLKLCDYEAALRILYGKSFTVVECEPGSEGCRGLVGWWIRRECG